MFRPLRTASLVAVIIACSCSLYAQSTFSSIVGLVRDPSGSLLAGASVTARNLDENTTRSATSQATGNYELLNLKPGRYELTASKAGFAVTKLPEVQLLARQELRTDFSLELATVQQTIVITDTLSTINTENGTVSDSKSALEITGLPLNYRGSTNSPLAALTTVPGVQYDRAGNISVAGGMPFLTEYTIDGVSSVNVYTHSAVGNMYPSTEMLDEFKVTSINNNAEFSQAGDVTVTTKSGSNQMHGSLLWYHQNRALDANTYGSAIKPAKIYNTFGGSLSGPVILPGVYKGKDRTFFYFAFEGNRKPGSGLVQASVPTAAMRNGDLTGLPGSSTVDPLSGLPFPNNRIPTSRINSVASKLLSKYYPAPNYGSGTSTYNNFQTLISSPTNVNGYDVRVDHWFNSQQQLYARWGWRNQTGVSGNGFLPTTDLSIPTRTLLVSHNYSITPNMFNEFRFGLATWDSKKHFQLKGADVITELGIQGLDISNHPDQGAFTSFDFSDGTSFSAVGVNKDYPIISRTYQFSDNLSWIKGKHSLKFGADYRQLKFGEGVSFSGSNDFGYFYFAQGAFSGNAYSDLMLGLPYYSFNAITGPDLRLTQKSFGAYAQDEWRVSSRLTLSFGLRWEVHPPFLENSGNITNFRPTDGTVIVPDGAIAPAAGFKQSINACPGVSTATVCTKIITASEAGLPQGLRTVDYSNWSPRFSFAYRPFAGNKTVLRGGIGVFTVTTLGTLNEAMAGIHSSDGRTYYNYTSPGVAPLFTLPQAHSDSYALTSIGSQNFIAAQNLTFRDPRSYQWNFTVEQAMAKDTALRVTYLGSNTIGMAPNVNMNQVHASTTPYSASMRPYLNWNRINSRENIAFAHYEGLQATFTKRLSSGVFLQSSYILSKNVGNVGGSAGGSAFAYEAGGQITDRFNLGLDKGEVPGSRRQRVVVSGIYDLPFGKGRKFGSGMNRIVDAFVGGWQLSTVSLFQTGPFLTPSISTSYDRSNTNVAGRGATLRPDRIGNGNVENPTPDRWFDITAFTATPVGAGRFGNAGVGILEGPGTIAVAGGLAKTFQITEQVRLRAEGSFTNLPNHPNFMPPALVVSNTTSFGKTSSTSGVENGGNRSGQVGLRLTF